MVEKYFKAVGLGIIFFAWIIQNYSQQIWNGKLYKLDLMRMASVLQDMKLSNLEYQVTKEALYEANPKYKNLWDSSKAAVVMKDFIDNSMEMVRITSELLNIDNSYFPDDSVELDLIQIKQVNERTYDHFIALQMDSLKMTTINSKALLDLELRRRQKIIMNHFYKIILTQEKYQKIYLLSYILGSILLAIPFFLEFKKDIQISKTQKNTST